MLKLLTSILLALALATPAPAQPAPQSPTRLTVGDPAPPLVIDQFIKGGPIPSLPAFEKGKVYIVEFWAVWCGPCIAGMPHLSELQAKYKDAGLTVISVTSADEDGNTLEAARKLVAARAAAIEFTVAWDKARTTSDAYLRAAGESAIPCAFLINRDGRIAFIGHPTNIDRPLAEVMAGTHDLAAAAARRKRDIEQQAIDDEADLKTAPLQKAFAEAVKAGDKAAAIKALDEIEPLVPALKSRIAQRRFTLLLTKFNDPAAAYEVANVAIPGIWHDDPIMLLVIATTITDSGRARPLDPKALAIAEAAARRAVEITKAKDPDPLETLASVYFEQSALDRAIETQQAALALAPADSDIRPALQATLDKYKAAKEKR